MRGSAVCTVTSGDPPIHISWYKDGLRLPEARSAGHRAMRVGSGGSNKQHINSVSIFDFVVDQIQIVSINDFMSSLVIANISRYHQGIYTCVASSPVATTNVSAHLTVRAAPHWRLKPVDHNAMAGESLTLDCQSSGQPQPIIRWKFARSDQTYGSEPVPILSSQHVHVLENGSLFLRTLEPKHSGVYICDTSNGVNKNTIEARARVEIFAPPKVIIQNTFGKNSESNSGNGLARAFPGSSYRTNAIERLVLRKGAQTQLMCAVIGIDTTPVTVEWFRPNDNFGGEQYKYGENENTIHPKRSGSNNGNSGERFSDSRAVFREETKLNEKRVYLYISHLNRHDSGVYACLATTSMRQSISFIEVLVQEAPDRPTNFRAQEISSRSVTLTWNLEYDGHSPIKSYMIEYWQHNTDPNTENAITLEDKTAVNLDHSIDDTDQRHNKQQDTGNYRFYCIFIESHLILGASSYNRKLIFS